MGFCIQGEAEQELPEVMLGVARLHKLDVTLADTLDAHDMAEEFEEDDNSDLEGGSGQMTSPQSKQMALSPATVPLTSPGLEEMFIDSGMTHHLRTRSATYLTNGRKAHAGPAFAALLRADLFRIDGHKHHLFRVDHICAQGRMQDRVQALLGGNRPPFLFVVNVQIPGDKAYSLVLCWGMRLKEAQQALTAGDLPPDDAKFVRLFTRYIDLDLDGGLPSDDLRNNRLKMFPSVVEGPFLVRKAIGKPCVIGHRLTARFFRRPGYLEADIDVGSNVLASNATHLASSCAKNFSLVWAFGLRGESMDELPERLIGSARIVKPDLDRAELLDG
ncbi:unnamed protein product [Choristocarpus tenellus]